MIQLIFWIKGNLAVGRNYWALDLAGSWSYANSESGFEVSATAGVLFNDRNLDTKYKTGNEFHLDWNVAQYFSSTFGVGITGYVYEQISDDNGTLVAGLTAENFNGFRGSGWGLGPSFLKSVLIGKHPINIVGKAIFDVDGKKRFKGDLIMIAVSLKL